MSFLNKSVFQQTFWTLVPFAAVIALLYSLLLITAMESTEDQVVKQYLQQEFERFSFEFQQYPENAALPRTSYLESHWADDPGLDKAYLALDEGLHETPDNQYHVMVKTPPGSDRALVMVVNERLLSTLDKLETPLIIAISIAGLIVTLMGALLATYLAGRLTQPLVSLAKDVSEEWEPGKVFSGNMRADEIGTLSQALTVLVNRLEKALEREQAFTRHASHEMRSPVSVIANSLSLLKLDNVPDEKRRRSLERIEQSCGELKILLDVFLCLGREGIEIPASELNAEELLDSLLEKYAPTLEGKCIAVTKNIDRGLSLSVPPAQFTILLNNMLRNAIYHGEKSVTVSIDQRKVEIVNKVPEGILTAQHGYGLEICERVCEQLGFKFTTFREKETYRALVTF